MSAIVVEQLGRSYGDFKAVDAVSFDVKNGEIFGYLGANGAGKSTTIKMLIGLVRPTEGRASVAGHDVVHDLAALRKSIGYVSQRFSLYLDLTPRENLEFFAGAYGLTGKLAKDRVAHAMQWAELDAREKVATGTLPGGIRQRLAVASAMLHQPEILFLDEPTAGVSPDVRRTFWRAIRDLAEMGKTIFVTTHHLDEAEYCNRVGLMVDGKLVALDTPDGLKQTHVPGVMLHVKSGEESVTRLLDALALLPGFVSSQVYGLTVHALFDAGTPPERIHGALSPSFPKVHVAAATPSLEDVFLAVVTNAETSAMGAK